MPKLTNNKYYQWYYAIIKNASNRTLTDYFEAHHIIPKSLGGTDDKDNLIELTAREHFICHLLLTKFTSGTEQQKMAYAAKRMMHSANKSQKRYKINSKRYEVLRLHLNNILVGRKYSEESKIKMSISAKIRCSNESKEIKLKRAKQLTALNKSRIGPRPKNTGKNNAMADPIIRQKHLESMNSQEIKLLRSENAKKLWKNPEYVLKHKEAMKRSHEKRKLNAKT